VPELPEVETLRQLLARRVAGARIEAVPLIAAKILRAPDPAALAAAVTGAVITGVGRRGKYLLLRLEKPERGGPDAAAPEGQGAWDLVIHLKMRGRLRIESESDPPGPYLCAELRLTDGRTLRYYDMWRWGEWALVSAGTACRSLPGLAAMGPEPLEPGFTSDYLARQLARRRGLLKPLLLGQQVVAGLGNIYCDECLHRARLHPARLAHRLRPDEVARLHEAIVSILGAAVAQGSALAERLAAQQANLDSFAGIYASQVNDRPGQSCPTCGQALQKMHLSGRGTTLCPHCQPVADFPESPETPKNRPR